MSEQELLDAAWKAHRRCPGAVYGQNFVECAQHRFHVHSGSLPPDAGSPERPHYLVKHWKSECEKESITSLNDPRLA